MQFLKLIFGKIGTGLLYGIGFALVMAAFTWGTAKYYENKAEDMVYGSSDSNGCRDFKKCEDKSGLVVSITSERINKEEFILLGNVKNEGDIKWTSVKVKAELFDKNNNFIDECSEYVDQKVFPGSNINFKLSCTECSKVNLQNYSKHTVKIIDADTY